MTVNADYIASVFLNARGQLEYRETTIKKNKNNKEILNQMKDMVGNPNRSLLDLQEKAAGLVISKDSHRVCIPYEYNDVYIHAPFLPEEISFKEYGKRCKEEKESLLAEKRKKEENGKSFNIEKEYNKFLHGLKAAYYEAISNYVVADEYITGLNLIKADSRHLMYSTENIGWTVFNYPISDTVNFEVRTNFGYGRSAYFYVNLSYKGIDIIPYADIVKYYYADMKQIGRYTRQYLPIHGSWPISLNFVVETANLAASDPDKFVETWIKNELSEMMQGLRRLRDDTCNEIHRFESDIRDDAENFISVRNIIGDDLKDLAMFPEEFPVCYKAYKISGALNFLKNMEQLSAMYTFVSDYIDELKQINQSILPEVEAVIKQIRLSLVTLEAKFDDLEAKLEAVEKKIQPFRHALEELKDDKGYFEQKEITRNFKSMNPKYAKLSDEIRDINQQRHKIRQLIIKRESFKTGLEESRSLILEVTVA